jgi:transcription initiation factor TFIIB
MHSPPSPQTEVSGTDQPQYRPPLGRRAAENRNETGPQCPACGQSIPTVDVDEAVCPRCDLVVEEQPVSTDRPPQYGLDDYAAKARTGGRVTFLYADSGVGVGINAGAVTDGNGNPLSRTQRRVAREKNWTKRRSSDEFRLDYGLGEIRRMGSAFDVPRSELESAALLYRKARREDLLHGRSADGFATACLLVAVRQSSLRIPVSERELREVSRASAEQIRNARGALEVFVDVEVPPMNPADFVPRLRSSLSAPHRVERCAIALLNAHQEDDAGRSRGFSPRTLVAAAFHAAYDLVGVDDRPTLAELSEVIDVSVGTISDRKGYLIQYQEAWS